MSREGEVRATWLSATGQPRKLMYHLDDWRVYEQHGDQSWVDVKITIDDLIAVTGGDPDKQVRRRRLSQDDQIAWHGTLEGEAIPTKLDSPAFREALTDWCRSRREKGNTVTKTVARRTFKKLCLFDYRIATAALEAAADAGWAGVFPEKIPAGQILKVEPTRTPEKLKGLEARTVKVGQ